MNILFFNKNGSWLESSDSDIIKKRITVWEYQRNEELFLEQYIYLHFINQEQEVC